MKWLVLFIAINFLSGCKPGDGINFHSIGNTPELLIYCENGLTPAIVEISELFETRYGCRVRIHNGDAQTLKGMLVHWSEGDLFIPDSYYGVQILDEVDSTLIRESLFLGYHQLVYFVEKGNPSGFDGRLQTLSDPVQMVALANPGTSSLGYETMKLLDSNNILREVSTNLTSLSVDNRGLTRSIINGDATVTINWLTSYFFNENREMMDTLNIAGSESLTDIYAMVLNTSAHPGLAYTFLAFLSSAEVREVFLKYGISKQV